MFTIKHVDSRFNEFAIEAGSYSVELGSGDPRGPGYQPFRFMTYDNKYRDESYTGLWVGEHHDQRSPVTDTIYVMNRYGATVGVYHFHAPQGVECVSAQADPAFVAAARAQAA